MLERLPPFASNFPFSPPWLSQIKLSKSVEKVRGYKGVRCAGFVRGRGDVRKEGGEVPARRPSSPPLAWVARRAEGCGTGSVRGRGAPCRRFSAPGRRR